MSIINLLIKSIDYLSNKGEDRDGVGKTRGRRGGGGGEKRKRERGKQRKIVSVRNDGGRKRSDSDKADDIGVTIELS